VSAYSHEIACVLLNADLGGVYGSAASAVAAVVPVGDVALRRDFAPKVLPNKTVAEDAVTKHSPKPRTFA
jgi:hypothetical protein